MHRLTTQRRLFVLFTAFALMGAASLGSCGGGNGSSNAASSTSTPEGLAVRTEVVSRNLAKPWGMAFLPDGRMLITEREGRLRRLDPATGALETISGTPDVVTVSQGGLLDVALSPQFATDKLVYWTFSEAGSGSDAGRSGTAVARGRLEGTALQDVQVIFRQSPKVDDGDHYGSRLVFARDGRLFVTLGERGQDQPASPGTAFAQNPDNDYGKVVRIEADGSIPDDNPRPGSAAAVWSLGHRNPQGAALHPDTGELWIVEHGPQGGDEINHVRKGGNYGWPLRSYGCPYGSPVGDACRVNGGTHAPDFIEPVAYWVPTSIAPAGLTFVTSDRYPHWRGHLLLGALAGKALWRVQLDGDREVTRERMLGDLDERIRDVRQGPDGWVYLLTDSGKLLRLLPS